MIMQYLIVGSIVLGAAAYCVITLLRMAKGKSSCGGCKKASCSSAGIEGLD